MSLRIIFVIVFQNGIILLADHFNNGVHVYCQTYAVNFVIPLGIFC